MSVHVVRAMMEGLPAPRNVFVRFRLGQVFGRPGAVEQQRAVLGEALDLLATAERPGEIRVLPHRLGKWNT